jgi:hypothetical protein
MKELNQSEMEVVNGAILANIGIGMATGTFVATQLDNN